MKSRSGRLKSPHRVFSLRVNCFQGKLRWGLTSPLGLSIVDKILSCVRLV
jgi:hypothetical protein